MQVDVSTTPHILVGGGIYHHGSSSTRPRGYKTSVHSQTQNKAQ